MLICTMNRDRYIISGEQMTEQFMVYYILRSLYKCCAIAPLLRFYVVKKRTERNEACMDHCKNFLKKSL